MRNIASEELFKAYPYLRKGKNKSGVVGLEKCPNGKYRAKIYARDKNISIISDDNLTTVLTALNNAYKLYHEEGFEKMMEYKYKLNKKSVEKEHFKKTIENSNFIDKEVQKKIIEKYPYLKFYGKGTSGIRGISRTSRGTYLARLKVDTDEYIHVISYTPDLEKACFALNYFTMLFENGDLDLYNLEEHKKDLKELLKKEFPVSEKIHPVANNVPIKSVGVSLSSHYTSTYGIKLYTAQIYVGKKRYIFWVGSEEECKIYMKVALEKRMESQKSVIEYIDKCVMKNKYLAIRKKEMLLC